MSQLLDKIKSEMTIAMKERQKIRRDILRFVISESNILAVRQNKPVTEDQVVKVIAKIIEKNEESIGYLSKTPEDFRYENLKEENSVLTSLMPKSMSLEETVVILSEIKDIKTVEKEGMAIGLAMKFLKESGRKDFDNKTVNEAVKRIRSN